MRKLREILRLDLQGGLGTRQIHRSLRVSLGAVSKIQNKARDLMLDWPTVEKHGDEELAKLFYPKADPRHSTQFELSDWSNVRKELARKGMTLQLAWEEYCEQFPNRCYSYAQYCHLYKEWLKKQKRSMRQVHKAGEKLFVDFAGQTVPIVDAETGQEIPAQIFVAVLGASNYTYVRACWSQDKSDWLNCHKQAFEFFGGVPTIVVPDNLKSGVSRACKYDPDLNPSYQQLAAHYSTAVVPARPYKPQDKAKAEVGVQIIERWILARLRHQKFFSLEELNSQILQLLKQVNNKPFKQLPGTRQSWFESIDKPALRALPSIAWEYAEIRTVQVNIDYHVRHEHRAYSVPHHLVGERVELRVTDTFLTVFFQNRQVAAHPRKRLPGNSTVPAHMPKSHHKHNQFNADRVRSWAKEIGPCVLTWVNCQFELHQHPEQVVKICRGLLSLTQKYENERLNAACDLAKEQGLMRLSQVKAILKSNQDKLHHAQQAQPAQLSQTHENVRGAEYFH